MKKKMFYYILGLVSGFLNGLFGSGGGIIAVPMLEKSGLEAKKAHATSIAIILPLSVISTVIYMFNKSFDIKSAAVYIPFGLIGAVIGSLLLKKIPNSLLRRIFGGIIIASAVKMLFF